MKYYPAIICKNGHVLSCTNSYQHQFCKTCGAEAVSRCESCGYIIEGYLLDSSILTSYYKKPYYCPKCGVPYPWTIKLIDNAVEIASLDTPLDEQSLAVIKNAIPYLITESIDTPVQAAKFANTIDDLSDFARTAIKSLLFDYACNAAKSIIWG